MHSQALGKQGEEYAERYLINNGHKIIARNYRGKRGEIDIVSKHGEVIVFVEVKTRRSLFRGAPYEAVDSKKIRTITNLSALFVKENRMSHLQMRIDVIAVYAHFGVICGLKHFKNVTNDGV